MYRSLASAQESQTDMLVQAIHGKKKINERFLKPALDLFRLGDPYLWMDPIA